MAGIRKASVGCYFYIGAYLTGIWRERLNCKSPGGLRVSGPTLGEEKQWKVSSPEGASRIEVTKFSEMNHDRESIIYALEDSISRIPPLLKFRDVNGDTHEFTNSKQVTNKCADRSITRDP